MKNHRSRRLHALLTGLTPSFRLPAMALRQFVGYYGDWRRSRDILNSVDDAEPRRPLPPLSAPERTSAGAPNS